MPNASNTDAKSRLDALKELLNQGKLSTQEELVSELADLGFEVTQSTISRDLRKIGAVKAIDPNGRTVYRMPDAIVAATPMPASSLADLVTDIAHNGSLIVIHTPPGSASLVARHLDGLRLESILGTLAGDDCIFVAPSSAKDIKATLKEVNEALA